MTAPTFAKISWPVPGLIFLRPKEFLLALIGKTKYSIRILKGSEHFGK